MINYNEVRNKEKAVVTRKQASDNPLNKVMRKNKKQNFY
jgi:hypothetical protein